MSVLWHLFDFAEIYAVALVWIAVPLFFAWLFMVLNRMGIVQIEPR